MGNGDWDIDPEGVGAVLKRTGERAGAFEGLGEGLATNIPKAMWSCQSPIVMAALSDFMGHHEMTLQNITEQAGASMTGAADATEAYLTGDLEMAAEAQGGATDAPSGEAPQGGEQIR